jgi:hypothetical protein
VVDADGRFVQFNQAAAAMCRRAVDELTGAPAPFGLTVRPRKGAGTIVRLVVPLGAEVRLAVGAARENVS